MERNKQWYRFWKRSGPNGELSETFSLWNEEDNVSEEVATWAGTVGGGFNTHYTYGFERVDAPPIEWLDKRLSDEREKLTQIKKRIAYYEAIWQNHNI